MQDSTSALHFAPELIWTVLIVMAVIAANVGISAALIRGSRLSRETKLRASVFWRNFSLLIALVALLFVWRTELRAAAYQQGIPTGQLLIPADAESLALNQH